MSTPKIIKQALIGLAGVVAGLAITTSGVNAIAYNGDQTVASPGPAFNVFTGVPSYGDESDFLRGRAATSGTAPFVDPIDAGACTDGQQIQLRVYVHNGASADGNNNGTGPSIAHGTVVKVSLPSGPASTFTPSATISASNAATVNDTATINCNGKTVTLSYVAGTAHETSLGGADTVALPDTIVSSGAAIKSETASGDVWGCWNERVYVVLTVKVTAVQPPTPAATCDLFTITAGDNRKVTADQFKTTVTNGAAFKSVSINWGDNSVATVLTDSNAVHGLTHQYANYGDYLITAVATFSAPNVADITSGGQGTPCMQKVSFKTTGKPVVITNTTPKQLVNTGAGSTIAIFGAVAAASTYAHRWFLRRKLGL